MRRIPTLDGWRGVAILMVLITHAQAGLTGRAWRYNWMDMGQHGVEIFFVLSGFLITSRLLSDDLIDLRGFYIRRFFRLMPSAWAYLLFVAAFGAVTRVHLIGRDAIPTLLIVRNYVNETSANAMTSHFWSLSIEEQFYLGWPVILFFTRRAHAIYIAAAGALACALFRFMFWSNYATSRHTYTEVRVDALLVGCIGALFWQHLTIRRILTKHSRAIIASCVPLLAFCMVRFQSLIPLSESVVVMFLVASTSAAPEGRLGRLLENRWIVFLGSISYSLYLWQEFFLVPHWGPVGIAMLPFAAITSYGLIERPSTALGRRLSEKRKRAPARTRGRDDDREALGAGKPVHIGDLDSECGITDY
jgi:peptidoglycan/LPS O-acetylase OafA/YrhL